VGAKIALSLALILAAALASNWWTWQKLTASQAEATKLRSSVQALVDSAARSTRALAEQRKRLAASEVSRVAAAQALERALAASPDWAATPVPPEVQNAP